MKNGIAISDLPERYQKQAILQIGDKSARPTAKLKCDTGNEQVAKKETKGRDRPYGFSCPVRVSYRDTRRRLIDADNGFTKFWTDALVSYGVCRDDSPKEIPERPSVKQRKAEEGQEESLLIVVEAL